MTEPVAYMWKTAGGNVLGFQEYKENTPYPGYATPLYTAEQLHPRVKMTQAEYDEFAGLYGKEYRGRGNVFFGLDQTINLGDYYPYLNKRLITDKQFDDNFAQAEFVNLWIKFNPSHPEETIEIVPDMKWFVVRKLPNTGGNMLKCSEDGLLTYNAVKEAATQFNTEDEAELWTNPLTEAVQLPVEDE